MGLGNWGTILIVIAVLWGVWTFFLSPNAGIARDVGGGIFDIVSGNQQGLEDKIKKYEPVAKEFKSKIESKCPGCSGKNGGSASCQQCVKNLANEPEFGENLLESLRNPGAGGGTSQIKKASYGYSY